MPQGKGLRVARSIELSQRRFFCAAFAVISVLTAALPSGAATRSLSREQAKTFRSWIVTIVEDQVSRGPNPRWHHRDCAGLVRFAIRSALETHDTKWRKDNGFLGKPLPAEIELSPEERASLKLWRTTAGERSDFVRAFALIQENAEFIGKTIERIEPGDLLFFDQGDEQHLMVWTGRRIVYHNGHRPRAGEDRKDTGLRAATLRELMESPDSRWRPTTENPNFVGFYRLAFLTEPSATHRGAP